MATLYELKEKYRQLIDLEEDLDPTLFRDTLESIEDVIEDKAVNYVTLIKKFKKEIEMFKEEENILAKRRKAIESKVSILKDNLYEGMKEIKAQHIKKGPITVRIQKNPPSVNITNEDLIPSIFYEEQPPKLNKKLLKEKLKDESVPGAELIQKEGVRY